MNRWVCARVRELCVHGSGGDLGKRPEKGRIVEPWLDVVRMVV